MEFNHIPCPALKIYRETQGRSIEIARWTDQFSFKTIDVHEGHTDEEEEHHHVEGCRLTGSTAVAKQPGNIRVEVSQGNTVGVQRGRTSDWNLSHKVHHLAFTDEENVSDNLKKASGFGHTKPDLNEFDDVDLFAAAGPGDQEEGIHTDDNLCHEYGLQLVPTIGSETQRSYQYSWTETTYPATWRGVEVPGITFHLEISPISIKLHRQQSTTYQLFLRICTICGGVYVMFLIPSLIPF